MKIAGFQKLSLVDYPQKLASVVFTRGCSFRCHYCHNPKLVLPKLYAPLLNERKILDFLIKRKKLINSVVISGGEPTQQVDLIDFIKKLKTKNFNIKLDTNGSNSTILKKLLDKKLLDYIAMDIKAPFKKYSLISPTKIIIERIKESIDIILNSNIKYEFRTTVCDLLSKEDLIDIAKSIRNAKKFILQKALTKITINPNFKNENLFDLNSIQDRLKKYVKKISII